MKNKISLRGLDGELVVLGTKELIKLVAPLENEIDFFDISEAVDMKDMFNGCNSLQTLDPRGLYGWVKSDGGAIDE